MTGQWVIVPSDLASSMLKALPEAALKQSTRKDPDSVGALCWDFGQLWRVALASRPPLPDDVVEAMARAHRNAFAGAFDEWEDCERCKGRGYHQGFGEDGHDPDWCVVCGGSGTVCSVTEEDASLIAIRAALAVLGAKP